MKNNIIPLPQRKALALPRRGYRPKTAVQKVKEKLDPLTMARAAGVLVEPGSSPDRCAP